MNDQTTAKIEHLPGSAHARLRRSKSEFIAKALSEGRAWAEKEADFEDLERVSIIDLIDAQNDTDVEDGELFRLIDDALGYSLFEDRDGRGPTDAFITAWHAGVLQVHGEFVSATLMDDLPA